MLLTSLLVLPLLSQQLPDGVPQPTLPTAGPVELWNGEQGWVSRERPVWLALSPPWLEREVGTPELRAELATAAAARTGMDPSRLADFLDARALEQVDLRYRLSAGGEVLLEGRDRLRPGAPASFVDGWTRGVMLDMDVEIASSSAIADPITGLQWGGRSLAVCLLPVPGKGWVAECALTESLPSPPSGISTGYADIHGLERLEARVAEAGFATLLMPGAPVRVSFPGTDGQQLELELQADAPLPAGVQPFGRGSWLDAGAAAADAAGWQRVLERWMGQEALTGSRQGFLLVEGDGHEERAASLLAGLQQATRPVALRVTWSVESGDETLDGGVISLPAVAGRALRFASGQTTRALTDWDVEVALDSRIADPQLQDLLSGVRGTLRPLPVRGGLLLDVDLEFTRVTLGEPLSLVLAGERQARESGDGVRLAGSPAQRVQVESVNRRGAAFRGRYATDAAGRVVLERAVPNGWGEGAVLRVVLEASTE